MGLISHDTANLLTTGTAGTYFTADQKNLGCRGIKVGVNVTVDGGTGTLTVTVQGHDNASGAYYDILVGTAQNVASGFKVLTVYPDLTAAANVTVNDVLPAVWRLKMVVANTVTATVGASVLL